jgi:asparagine synthase (glutamine-hydrolysing)
MCGMSGFIFDARAREVNTAAVGAVKNMMHAIVHRGRDGEGLFVDAVGRCILAHRRLAIVDESADGMQPMTTLDGRYTLVFNGEIYNYKTLASELSSLGVVFATQTDTEVILQGFSVWGVDVFKRLRGMFACVVWDAFEQRALLVRDQFGIKPLYWARVLIGRDSGIIFASELKAILASGLVAKIINKQALQEYMQFSAVHAPLTMIQGIHALEPATIMTLADGHISQEVFWDIASIHTETKEYSFADRVARVREKFIEACSLYTDSNLDVGAFLSGGIDSTAVVGCVRQLLGKPLQTFALGFSSPTGSVADESEIAQRTAQRFGAKHHELRVDGHIARLAFRSFVSSIDQPSSDGLNTFLISRLAGEHVKVVLSGLGGDELFLGYRYFNELLNMQRFGKLPGASFFEPVLSDLVSKSSAIRSVAYKMGCGFLQHGPARKDALYKAYRSLLPQDCPTRVLNFDVRSQMFSKASLVDEHLERVFSEELDELNAFSKAELAWYIPGILARDTDAASMAATIEVRVPFLDIELVELTVAIPSFHKRWANQETNKPLFVQAFRDILPDEVALGQKRGFEMPLGFWLKAQFRDQLEALKNERWVDRLEVARLCDQLNQDPREYRKLWSLLVLAEWKDVHGLSF